MPGIPYPFTSFLNAYFFFQLKKQTKQLMKRTQLSLSFRRLVMGLGLSLGVLACEQSDSDTAPYTATKVKIASNATLGNFLTDGSGKTLYFFTKDVDGVSTCTEGCLTNWPIFFEETLTIGSGLDVKDFGSITRADGKKQTTYKGWPLYHFAKDEVSGDTKGNGAVNNTFFVANPSYTVFVADKNGAKFLVDERGQSLYQFDNDAVQVSNCTGGCLQVWPQFFATNATVPSFLKSSDFGTITRSDGKQQTTFKQKPLYYFASDAVRGDAKGNAANAKFKLAVNN
jgi:predicted lipoprotein with Yx(FWY)xxD motif